jgi:hypothetical protein
MSATQFLIPYPIVAKPTNIGAPGSTITFYQPATTTLKAIYTDSTLTTQQANPLTADGAGRWDDIYLDGTTTYKIVIEDKNGAVLFSQDPYTPGVISSITGPAGDVAKVATRTELAAITGQASGATRYLAESGREGTFVWSTANNAANVTLDTRQGVYVAPASDTTGASGAWVRKFSGPLDVRWFGAVADATAAGVGTDNYAAIQAALDFFAATGGGRVYIPSAPLPYRCSARLQIKAATHLFGDVYSQNALGSTWPGLALGSTLYFDAGVGGIINWYTTNLDAIGAAIYPGGTNTIIERVRVISAGAGAAAAGKYGIEARGVITLRDCEVNFFGDDGVVLRGAAGGSGLPVYGNVSCSLLERVRSTSNAGNGFYAEGGDANVITFINCSTAANGEYGFYDNGLIGNQYIGALTEGNTLGGIWANTNAAHTFIGCEIEGATCIVGTACTVLGGTMSEVNSGQRLQIHGRLDAFDGALLQSGGTLTLNKADNSNAVTFYHDGTYGRITGNVRIVGNLTFDGVNNAISSVGVLQAAAFPALSGDISTSAGSLVTAIGAGKVTLAMQANMATASVVYRKTAGAGAPEVQTLATLKTDLGLTGTNSGDQTSIVGITGTIAQFNTAITDADIVPTGLVTASGLTMSTGKLLGRSTAATGAVEELATVPAANMPALTGDVTSSAGAVATVVVKASDGAGTTFASFSLSGVTCRGVLPDTDNTKTSGTTAARWSAVNTYNVDAKGSILSSSATLGIGYTTGAGGAVTQLTSKSTAPPAINKMCGQITMNNAALAAGAKVSFAVSNSSCAATDIPQVAVVSGGTANAYRANVTAVAASSFTVTVENITAGSLSEAPVIGFFINKAVTS